ncbi:TPA: HepT-like ribonuclease domain-containing protein [Aeromonas hydrophila]
MAHGYFDIKLDIVWNTIQEWLPELLTQLSDVIPHAEQARDQSC